MRILPRLVLIVAASCGKSSSSSSGGGGTPIGGSGVAIDLPSGWVLSPSGSHFVVQPSTPTDVAMTIDVGQKPITKDDQDRMARESIALKQGGVWDRLPSGLIVFQHGGGGPDPTTGPLVTDAYLPDGAGTMVWCHARSANRDMQALNLCQTLHLAR